MISNCYVLTIFAKSSIVFFGQNLEYASVLEQCVSSVQSLVIKALSYHQWYWFSKFTVNLKQNFIVLVPLFTREAEFEVFFSVWGVLQVKL